METPASSTPGFVPICAIGASAGGVSALQALFRQLPGDLGLAYVVILHMPPDQPSALSEILQGCTKLPVHQVRDSPTLKPNCVYVIAPDSELVVEGDRISARDFADPRGRRAPIDVFFRSIAAGRGDGVAIVLSGAGSDGATGVRAIKEAGGVVMVQEPADADFAPMPQNAIATGVADFIGTVAHLAESLGEVARSKEAVRSLDMDGAANDLRRIIAFLRSRTGHDFSGYKRATVMRRVTRRMQVCRAPSLGAYADYLMVTPEEAKELFSDLLISVTMFFRDARAFEALGRHAVAHLFEDLESLGDEGLRAWVVGCATGEEAYSLTILLLEEASRRQVVVPIQVFATDLDEGALATAREGRYPKSIEADVSSERLARFFLDEGTHYRIRKEVRDGVLFASHSVLKEPPFMRLDLISCRNLLIYLERNLQEQVCAVFHYGLKTGRYLFLGSAETADTVADLFAPIDRDARLYSAKPDASPALPILPQFPTPERLQLLRSATPFREPGGASTSRHLQALETNAPPSALVDSAYNVLHISETAGRFIQHSAGPLSSRLPAVVRPELRLELQLALARALEQGTPTLTQPVAVTLEGTPRRLMLYVAPRTTPEGTDPQALVFFLDGGPAGKEELGTEVEARPEQVRRLHVELKSLQEALVASRSGHDATIEDLRATNEELQSTNEEYRSTAEELETSREELQSINEELRTVNAELKNKLEAISSAHDDLQNLTAATEIGTLFLDDGLRIRMFTPPIHQLFNVTRMDVGRVITDFTHQLDHDGLVEEARRVLDELTPSEREVHTRAGRWYVMRLRPYRTVENRISGVVVTFVDITTRREAQAALAKSEQQFRSLVEASAQVIYRMNPDWTILRQLSGGDILPDIEEPSEDWFDRFIPVPERARVRSAIENAVETKGLFDFEHQVVRIDGGVGWMHSRAIPMLSDDGAIAEWFGSGTDVTGRREAEAALRDSEERLRSLIEGVPQLIWRADRSGEWTWSSPQWDAYTGLDDGRTRSSGWLLAIDAEDRDRVQEAWFRALRTHQLQVECRVVRPDGERSRWFSLRAEPRVDAQGQVIEWLGTFTDVDDLHRLKDRQRVLLHELQHRVRNTLAVVRSITSRTEANSETVEDFASHLQGRISALARTQAVLTSAVNDGVDLENLIREELLAQAAPDDQVVVEGLDVLLSAKAAEVVALAVHELATNATKYGALTSPSGRVRVVWSMMKDQGETWLSLSWTESGVRIVAPAPRREGFGTELITARVPYELRGRGSLEIRPGGVHAEIAFPLRPGESILQTQPPVGLEFER